MSCVNNSLKLVNDVLQLQRTHTFNCIKSLSSRCYSGRGGKDFYDVLGIDRKSTAKDIKEAYYELSKIHHPDRNKGCEKSAKTFRSISEAYEVLGNYRTRRLYDKGWTRIMKIFKHFFDLKNHFFFHQELDRISVRNHHPQPTKK